MASYAECGCGKPRVRMEVAYMLAEKGRARILDVGCEAGEVAARVVAGLVSAWLGKGAFVVRRVASPACQVSLR